eukprot:COSAG01_NODE_5662_length_4113_cov_3.017190_4_plen_215_part_00
MCCLTAGQEGVGVVQGGRRERQEDGSEAIPVLSGRSTRGRRGQQHDDAMDQPGLAVNGTRCCGSLEWVATVRFGRCCRRRSKRSVVGARARLGAFQTRAKLKGSAELEGGEGREARQLCGGSGAMVVEQCKAVTHSQPRACILHGHTQQNASGYVFCTGFALTRPHLTAEGAPAHTHAGSDTQVGRRAYSSPPARPRWRGLLWRGQCLALAGHL